MYIKKNLIFFREELRDLFPYVWSSKCVYDSFKGYSHNQHKKMFDEKEEFAKRRFKYAVAHLRVLLQGIELLATGDFSVEIRDTYPYVGVPSPIISKHITSSWRAFLMLVKNQQVDVGDVVSVSEYLKTALLEAYNNCPNKEVNITENNKNNNILTIIYTGIFFNPSFIEPFFTVEIIIPENKPVTANIMKANILKSVAVIP